MNQSLSEKYRPRLLADLVGQPWIVSQLTAFVQDPVSCAMLFEGDTGTGKTSAGFALARELGVDVEEKEFGGLHEIASGEQTGESVRQVMRALAHRPFSGSGWRVLLVNEADAMTPNASFIWLDALENLPLMSVVIFTTNKSGKLPARLRDRCEGFHFESGALLLQVDAQELIAKVWKAETGRDDCPALDDIGSVTEDGSISFRRVLQLLSPLLRRPEWRKPISLPLPIQDAFAGRSAAAKKAWETRRNRKAVLCG